MNTTVLRTMRVHLFFLLGAGLLFSGTGSEAASMKERYEAADKYSQKYGEGCLFSYVTPEWINNEQDFWFLSHTAKGAEFILVEPKKGTKTSAFDHEALAKALATALQKEIKPYALPFSKMKWDKEKTKIEFSADGKNFLYDTEKKELKTAEAPAVSPTHNSNAWNGKVDSPDGKYEARIRAHNVYIKEKAKGTELRLSVDGSPGDTYNHPIQWSPDSKRLVCSKSTVVPEREVTLVEGAPADQLQPIVKKILYRKPGDALPITRPVSFTLEENSGKTIVFDSPEKQFHVGDVKWSKSGDYFTFIYNKRGHDEFIIYRVDADSDQARPVVKEKADTFISYTNGYRHDIEDKGEILWLSERDGWRHLYLFDAKTGDIRRQVTKGEWIVKNVLRVDEKERRVLFTAGGRDKGENPYLNKICSVSLDGGEVTCLTPEPEDHSVVFSPDGNYFIDCMSRADIASHTVLRETATGKVMMELADSDISGALKKGWKAPDVFCAKGRDGETDIWGQIILPADFEKGKKYPVIEYIYAGPHGYHVPQRFYLDAEANRYTELGFIVVKIDGMGTTGRSKKFHDVCWKNIKDAGFPDRIAWMKAAAGKYPEMDLSRVGIYGMSAGGQNAMGAVLFHPDFYKVAVAACGCHDNRMDKIWWNEQWMGYPVGKHYEENSNVVNAHLLKGHLMIINGEIDNNVDPSSSVQVVKALIKANKEFEYVLIPSAGHTMGEQYGERKRRDFFIKHLVGEKSPLGNK